MTEQIISPSGSVKGYSWTTWFVKNKEYVKATISIVGGLITYYLTAVPEPWHTALGGASVVIGKMILDGIDFWSSNVQVQQ